MRHQGRLGPPSSSGIGALVGAAKLPGEGVASATGGGPTPVPRVATSGPMIAGGRSGGVVEMEPPGALGA